MKILYLPAVLMLAGACGQPAKWKNVPAPPAQAESYLVESVYEVLDKESRQRLGLVAKHRYRDPRVIYWVTDTSGENRGYVLANNQAYKYDWHAGQRATSARFVGADTITAGSRRVLGYGRPVTLEETSLQALLAELSQSAKDE